MYKKVGYFSLIGVEQIEKYFFLKMPNQCCNPA